jgi:hypothetical protein
MPLPPAALLDFLSAHERLFRLHPHWHIQDWQLQADGSARLGLENESNGQRLATVLRCEPRANGFVLHYSDGLKQASEFVVTTHAEGSALEVIDRYAPTTGADDPRLMEVDPTLLPWLMALRRYLLARQRWGWFPGWHAWHDRLMASMAPKQRRVVRLIVWATILEFVVFLGLVAVLRFI